MRSGFYRERLPDGSTLDRPEPAMSKLEKKALRVIRGFEEHWPLSDADRAPVAEFLALQLMRSPAWRDWYSVALDNAHRWTRESRPEDSDESLEQVRDHMALDNAPRTHRRQPRGDGDGLRQHALDSPALWCSATRDLRPSTRAGLLCRC